MSRTVLLRLARLPAPARSVAGAVAVLGDRGVLPAVAALAGVAEPAASGTGGAGAHDGLLRCRGSGVAVTSARLPRPCRRRPGLPHARGHGRGEAFCGDGRAADCAELALAALEGGRLRAADPALIVFAAIVTLVMTDRPEVVEIFGQSLADAHRGGSLVSAGSTHLCARLQRAATRRPARGRGVAAGRRVGARAVGPRGRRRDAQPLLPGRGPARAWPPGRRGPAAAADRDRRPPPAPGGAGVCGAGGLAARVRSELHATGSRPRRDALGGVDSLTPSERRVVDLAVAGRSSREIAQELYVTPKTVEVHLSNAYRKLGIRSRRELEGALGAAALP